MCPVPESVANGPALKMHARNSLLISPIIVVSADCVRQHRVFFAPHQSNFIGIYDTETNTFDASVGTGALHGVEGKFLAAASLGNLVGEKE